jgi:hypothetical protein
MCARLCEAAPAIYALVIDTVSELRSAFDFCRERVFRGVGWSAGSGPLDWPGYEQRARAGCRVGWALDQEVVLQAA